MAEYTVQHYVARIPIAMPAVPQGDGDPGYTVADAAAVLKRERDARFVAQRRVAFIDWAARVGR